MKLVPTPVECSDIILGAYAGASFYNPGFRKGEENKCRTKYVLSAETPINKAPPVV